jgi:hypothetical protein
MPVVGHAPRNFADHNQTEELQNGSFIPQAQIRSPSGDEVIETDYATMTIRAQRLKKRKRWRSASSKFGDSNIFQIWASRF